MAAISAPPAFAFDLFGLKLFDDQSDKDTDAVIADPVKYSVTFEAGTAPGDVASAAQNASALMSGQNEPASGSAGLVASARGDYRRIIAALYDQGYYGGTVNIFVNGREAAGLQPDANLAQPVAVRIVVNSGPLFHFRNLAIINRAPETTDEADKVDSPESQGYAMGAVAKSSVVLKAEQLQVNAWRQQGFPMAKAGERQVVADHATNSVDVIIRIDPNRQAAIGPVRVTGTENMDPEFVAQQTGLVVGEPYDPDTIAKAQKRLNRLEVFKSMRIQPDDAIRADGLLPFNVIVQEQALNRFGVGATFSTVDGFGVEGSYLRRNIFGHAERLQLDAKVAGIAFPIDTADFDYAFGGTFTKPGLFTPDTDLVAAIGAERTVLDNYTETSVSGRVGLTHMLTDQVTLDGGLTAERSRFDDDFGTRDFATIGAYGGVTLDTRDDPNDAHEGWYANATFEPFYELNYGNLIGRATAEARTYFGFTEDDKLVLAGRVKVGALLGPDLSEIPPDKLFFAGGGGSVRGYGFKSIGVDGPNNTVTGGRYLLEGSLEARYKVTNDIGVVGFLDGGYVAADTFPGLEDLRVGAGIGVRYYTGLGPLRLDAAIPLNRRPGDPKYAIYVGIGQAF
ncbi:MAG TPA: autotransporter assembly complex family protein [Devosiaceae bacterium]